MTLDPMLSRFIAGLGLLLPFALYLMAGRQESISAYYHTSGQATFLLILLSVAGLLAAFGVWDRAMPQAVRNIALAASLALAVTALVPTSGPYEQAHGVAAVLFFLMAAWLTWQWGPDWEFKALAAIILASVVGAAWAAALKKPIYWPEVAAIMAFALGWLKRGL